MNYIVITGASSGIGRATALAFAKRGFNLILAARRKDKLEELKQDILELDVNLDVVIKVVDLAQKEAVYEFYQFTRGYSLAGWLNVAGLGKSGTIISEEIGAYDDLLSVNVEATLSLSQLFVKDYADKDAQLINVSSAVGYLIAKDNVVYSASKFFVNAFTQGLASEMVANPLQVKIFAPALTATDFIGELGQGELPPYVKPVDEVVGYLLDLWDSKESIGLVNDKQSFVMTDKILPELNQLGD